MQITVSRTLFLDVFIEKKYSDCRKMQMTSKTKKCTYRNKALVYF